MKMSFTGDVGGLGSSGPVACAGLAAGCGAESGWKLPQPPKMASSKSAEKVMVPCVRDIFVFGFTDFELNYKNAKKASEKVKEHIPPVLRKLESDFRALIGVIE